jgi:septum formation protein
MLDNLKDKTVILASASPRRRMLIEGLDIPLEIVTGINADESFPAGMDREEIPVFLAGKKAEAAQHLLREDIILLTADTIVLLDGEMVGKPADEETAKKMLQRLSGRKHRVITGVCLRSTEKEKCFSTATDVYFGILTPEEIDYYVNTYKPLDKAGSYGIQEWIGYVSVEKIEGSFYNVMGLPVHQVYRYLKEF